MIDPIDLNAVADNELDSARLEELRREISTHPELAAQLDSILLVKAVLNKRCVAYPCEDSWRACVKRLDEIDRSNGLEHIVLNFANRYAWGFCAILFVIIFSARFLNRGVQGESMISADILKMSGMLRTERAPQTTDQAKMNVWLDGILGNAMRSIDPRSIHVVNGACGICHGRQVSILNLYDGSGPMSLTVIKESINPQDMVAVPGQADMREGVLGHTNCVEWPDSDGDTLFLSGARSHKQLVEVAQLIWAQH